MNTPANEEKCECWKWIGSGRKTLVDGHIYTCSVAKYKTPANKCPHCEVAEQQGVTHIHPANEWREEFDEKQKLGNDVGESHIGSLTSAFIDVWDAYDDEANDCQMTSQDRKMMRDLLHHTLDTHSAHLVERMSKLKKDDVPMEHGDPNSHYYAGERDGYNQALDQAIDIVNGK